MWWVVICTTQMFFLKHHGYRETSDQQMADHHGMIRDWILGHRIKAQWKPNDCIYSVKICCGQAAVT